MTAETSLRIPRGIAVLSIVFTSLCMANCGKTGPSDTDLAFDRIISLSEVAMYDERVFTESFVKGAVTENRGDYARLGIEVAGEGTVSGKTAEVPVKLTPRPSIAGEGGVPASTDKLPKGTIQTTWTLKKVGDSWKIAEAPLK